MTIYEPREDSFLMEGLIADFAKGKKVLDMCAGSGILALAAQDAGAAKVVAADINQEAVNFCKRQGLKAIKSDLFSEIKEKFDLIVCNPPYLPEDERENKDSSLATAGGKNGDELICRFIKQAPKYLEKEGQVLLLVSSLTPMRRFNDLLEKLKFHDQVIGRKKLHFEELLVLLIERG